MQKISANIKECEVCRKQATNICYEWFIYFCDSCYKIAHDNLINTNHKKDKIDYFIPIDTKCQAHPKNPINLFCLDEKELCCAFCFFKNLHLGHKVLAIDDEEALKKENIKFDISIENFNDISQKAILLKEKIEKEINEIDQIYNKVNNELTKLYEIKHEELLKKENELREKLQNETTKIKEQLEYNLSDLNSIIKKSEIINKGIKFIEKEKEKNMLKTLSYISGINKIKRQILNFNGKLIKNLKISFDKEKSDIKYEEYYFNGIQIPKDIEFRDIGNTSFNIFWKIDDINIIGVDNKQIKYKVEIRKENSDEKFIYEVNKNNCLVNNLSKNTNYEIKIVCFYNNLVGNWSQIQKVKTIDIKIDLLNESVIINKDKDKIKSICEWINPNKNLDFKLLFRMSRDGSNCSDFHRCCDNKGETLLLIKTSKNYIFGAYAALNWTSPMGGEINDPKDNLTFLFSLDKMKKFTKIPGKDLRTVRSQKEYGPLLGGGTDLGIDLNMNTGWSNNGTFLSKRELTNGESNFSVNEMEIFQILK